MAQKRFEIIVEAIPKRYVLFFRQDAKQPKNLLYILKIDVHL